MFGVSRIVDGAAHAGPVARQRSDHWSGRGCPTELAGIFAKTKIKSLHFLLIYLKLSQNGVHIPCSSLFFHPICLPHTCLGVLTHPSTINFNPTTSVNFFQLPPTDHDLAFFEPSQHHVSLRTSPSGVEVRCAFFLRRDTQSLAQSGGQRFAALRLCV